MQPLDRTLSAAREARQAVVVPYLMVDRARRRRLAATADGLASAGAAALELGFPFSDPIADGPTLEAAADRALRHGTHWADLLEQLTVASRFVPTAVMTYANPVWARGLGRALEELRRAGATGLIVPDLSLEEAGPWRTAAGRAGLALVLLAAPSASRSRVAEIARASRGFLYLVSRFGTTGAKNPAPARELAPLVTAAHAAVPRLPVLIGFGVHDRRTARAALASGADGVVVGSALEQVIAGGASPAAVGRWVGGILGGGNPASAEPAPALRRRRGRPTVAG